MNMAATNASIYDFPEMEHEENLGQIQHNTAAIQQNIADEVNARLAVAKA